MKQNLRPSRIALALVASTSLFAAACSGGDDDAASTPNAWQGHTYLLSIPETSWIEPDPRIGGEIAPFVPDFVLRVDAAADPTMSAAVGTSKAGAQDTCNLTLTVSGSSAYPNGTLSAQTYPMHIHDADHDVTVNTTVYNLQFKNVLPNGLTTSTTGEFSATLDAREIYPLFYKLIGATPDAVCTALGQYDANCQACPNDGGVYCLPLKAIGVGAVESSAAFTDVAEADLDASCADTQ